MSSTASTATQKGDLKYINPFVQTGITETEVEDEKLESLRASQAFGPLFAQQGNKKRFIWLHGFSVVITLGHIITATVVLFKAVS